MSDDSAGSTGEVVERDEGSIPQAADSSCTTTASEQPDTGSNVGECDTDSTSVPHDTNNADIPRVALLKKELFQNTLRVTVGNTTVNGLIDTGASISVISCNFISKLKPSLVKYLQSDINKIYGVGNVAHDVTEKVQLSLRVGNQKLTQCFYILRQNQYDIILGMDFIRQHQVKMDFSFSDPEITIAGQKHYLQPPPTRSMLAKTLSAVTIMGYSAMDVPVKLSKSLKTQLMLLEPVSSLTRYAPGLSVADSLVSSQVTYCRIANTTDTPISLPDNCVVAIARTTTLNCITEQSEFYVECTDDQDHDSQGNTGNSDPHVNTVTGDGDTGNPDSTSPDSDNITLNVPNATMTDGDMDRVKSRMSKRLNLFTTSQMSSIGFYDLDKHRVDTETERPQSRTYYRESPLVQREIDRQVMELLRHGFIEPSTSMWRSPVVLVKKRDGTYRFTCDFRKLNAVTIKQSFPVPRLEDVWDLIGERKSKFFTTLDLASGFWQIAMDEETKHKTTFVTRNGQYCWNRLPYGLCNSPITFQKVMNKVLGDLLTKSCLCYCDDILVHSATLEEHLDDIDEVLDKLEEAGLKLKASKCKFAADSVKYLGHIITAKGVLPNPEKIAVVENYPVPQNPTHVRQFMGLVNYYRRFVKGLSTIARPLQDLTQKDVPWVWTEQCQSAFELLKSKLITPPCLAYADTSKPFILTTDASSVAIAFILSQKSDDGIEHVIEYSGRALRKGERNYGITDLEALAVIEGFAKYHPYLYGNFTTVVTDHAALVYMKNNIKTRGKLGRWALSLSNYNYEVVHRPGAKLGNADALSRLENYDTSEPPEEPMSTDQPDVCTISLDNQLDRGDLMAYPISDDFRPVIESVMAIQNVDITKLQADCPQIGPIYNYIKHQIVPDDPAVAKHVIAHEDEYGIRDNALFHVYYPRSRNKDKFASAIHQMVLPKDLRPTLVSEYHESIVGGGHQGFERVYEAVKQRYYWPRMYEDIREYVKSCTTCQRAKNARPRPPPLHPLPTPTLFNRWHMDFLGPVKPSADGKRYILLIVDAFSRWSEAFAVEAADAITVAKVLYSEIITRYGVPHEILTDRGTHFANTLIEALCKIFNVRRTMTSPYKPSTNAACERMNSFINQTMRTYVDDSQEDWPKYLPAIMMAYRHTPATRSTEYSPFFLLFGQHMNLPIDNAYLANNEDVAFPYRGEIKSVLENMQMTRQIAKENNERHQALNKTYHDRSAKDPDYEIGELVWLHNPRVPVGLSKKFRPQWYGPFRICEANDNHTYRLRDAVTHDVSDTLIHASRLKPATLHDESALRNHHRTMQQRGAPAPAQARDAQPPPNQNVEDEVEDAPGQPDEPPAKVEKVVNLCKNNKGRWYQVKFEGIPGTKWYLEGFIDIPNELIEECLKKKTWQGKTRKRKQH